MKKFEFREIKDTESFDPKNDVVKKIADALGVSLDVLMK